MKKTLVIIFLLLVSCTPRKTPPPTPTSIPATMPDDFRISYLWTSGAIEYHYRYTISLEADAGGEISFMPHYPSEDPPVWVEQFPVGENLLPDFFEKLYNAGVFAQSLIQAEEIPAGGHTSQMSIVAYGNKYEIPYQFDDPENEKAIYALYDEIESLIPQEVMDSFMAQRETYIESYEGEW